MEVTRAARPWYCLRWLTWNVVAFVGTGLVAKNLLGMPEGAFSFAWLHGWPTTFLIRDGFPVRTLPNWWAFHDTTIISLDWFGLALDLAIALAILACTAFAIEQWRRRHPAPIQFGVRSILSLTVVAAMVLGLLKDGRIDWEDLLWLPIGLGLVCTVFTVGLGVIVAERWSRAPPP